MSSFDAPSAPSNATTTRLCRYRAPHHAPFSDFIKVHYNGAIEQLTVCGPCRVGTLLSSPTDSAAILTTYADHPPSSREAPLRQQEGGCCHCSRRCWYCSSSSSQTHCELRERAGLAGESSGVAALWSGERVAVVGEEFWV